MIRIQKNIFRAYDIRGIVDTDFDAAWVELLGKAVGEYLLLRNIQAAVVGHDCRHVSQEYQDRITAGLASVGVDVVCLGMVPTPVLYYAVKKLQRKGGVMITASHNPPEYNGFKIWAGDTTIHTDEIQNIRKLMEKSRFSSGRGLVSYYDILPAYQAEIAGQVQPERPVKVIVDGGNGVGGEICAELLTKIGARVQCIYCKPDGSFPNHHPDPVVPENIRDLQKEVRKQGAAFGIGLDGDADRIGVVDENGDIVYGDRLLAIFARDVLPRHPGGTVIAEGKCSHLLYKEIEESGGRPLMWITGHSMIKAKMLETGAILAGEMSGHMFFADRWYGLDDAIYSAARLVEIAARNPDKPLSQYLDHWPAVYNTPEIRLDCPEEVKFKIAAQAVDYFRERYSIVDIDGVRITFTDGWALLRASNTQPALVLRFEAESPERLKEIRSLVEEPLAQWIEEFTKNT